MASNDSNDFWGKGTPSNQPPQDPNEGFWGGAKKKDASKAEPPKTEPAPSPKSEEGGAFWGTGKSTLGAAMSQPSEPDKPADPSFWNKAEEKKKVKETQAALPEDVKQQAKKRRKRKIILISVGSVLLFFVLLIALAPTIAGWIAPGIIESQAGKQISGKVTVESASFGWFGSQRVEAIHLLDKDGKEIARLSVEAEVGLAHLVTGKLDIGNVTLSGVKADVVRFADGTTNIERAIAPKTPAAPAKPAPQAKPAPAPAKPAETKIPDSLNAHLIAKNMQVSFTDLSKPATPVSAQLKGMDLDVKVGAGMPLSVMFYGDAVSGATTGKLSATIKADKLIRKDGVVEPNKATIDADISAKGIPLQLVDAFAAMGDGVSIQKGLGDTIDVTIKANGSLKEAKATLTATATNLAASADLRVADSVLTTQKPIDVTIKGEAIRAMVPAIDKSLEQSKGTATVTTFPNVHLTVQNLKLPIPSGGDLNLRGASASVMLGLSEMVGTVAISGDKQSPFRVAPLETHVDAADLAKDVHVTVATSATVNSQPAGNVSVDITLAGLLDDKGAPVKGPPGSVQGTFAVKQIATAIAQPFVEAFKINLPQDVGPTLDIEARANSDLHGAAAGATPPTDITLSVQSQGFKVAGAMKLTAAGLTTVGDGLRVEVTTAGQMAARFVGPETGWRVIPGQAGNGTVVTVKGLNVPMDAKGAMQLDKAAGELSVSIGAMSIQSLAAPGTPPIELQSLALGAKLASGGSAKVDINSALAYSGAKFGAVGNFDIPGLIIPPATAGGAASIAPPERLRPVGKLEIKDVPTALAKAAMPPAPTPTPAKPGAAPGTPAPGAAPAAGAATASATPAAPALDIAKLLSDTLGPSVTVSLNTAAVQGSPEAINAAINVKTATTTVDVQADVGKTQLALKKLNVQANVTPQTVSGLMAAFAPNVEGAPHLAGPSKIVLQVDPITVPLADYKPQLDRAGQASIKLSLPGKTVVDGLVVANADGTKRDLGRVGVDSLEITVKAGVGALVGPVLPEDRKATVSLSGTVLGSSNEPMLELAGQVQTLVSDGMLAGPLTATAKVDKISTRSIEELAGQDGMLTGSLGNTASVELKASVTPPPLAPGAAPGAPFDIATAVIGVEVTLAAPNLHSDGPIKASITPTAIQIDKPVKLTLDADPAFINKMLEPKPDPKAKPSDPKPAPAVKFTDPASVTLTISSLTFPRPGAKDAPPVSASVGVAIPNLKMLSSDKQAIHLSQLAVQVNAQPVKGGGSSASVPVTLKMDVAEAAVGDQPPVKGLVLIASVTDLLDAAAQVSTKLAVVNAQGDLPVVPTALVDTLAKQNGTLVEAMGPVVTLKVNIERYPLGDMKPGGTPPVIDVHATASRVTADLRGTIRSDAAKQPPEMIFVSETPIKITILELTKELAARFIKGLPIIGSIEKTKQDAPGQVSASNMTVPLNDDMVKLNGDVLIDPGEARFGTSGAFASVLKSINQKEAGTVGNKLQPLNIEIRNGIATYQKWIVPIGEFNVETEGTVDLVHRTMDVVTWLPLGSLTEQALTATKSIGGYGAIVLDAATMVPFRTKGSLDKPSTALDTSLFAKTVAKQLSPGDLLKKGAGDLLKDKVPGIK